MYPYVTANLQVTAHCETCGWDCTVPAGQTYGGAGYGYCILGAVRCYDCCSIKQRRDMAESGEGGLYLTRAGLTDWNGGLSFRVIHRKKTRIGQSKGEVAYFIGPDGKPWSARSLGDMDLARARRIKQFPFYHPANAARRKEEVILPAYWASALVNGDWSGLTDDEAVSIRRTLMRYRGWRFVSCSDEFFTWGYFLYDLYSDTQGGMVSSYTILKG